jgi:hypothetical protein
MRGAPWVTEVLDHAILNVAATTDEAYAGPSSQLHKQTELAKGGAEPERWKVSDMSDDGLDPSRPTGHGCGNVPAQGKTENGRGTYLRGKCVKRGSGGGIALVAPVCQV